MHEWGMSYTGTITHAGAASKVVDNLPWDPSYMFHPPQQTFDVSTPYVLHQGDAIDIHCQWNNNTSRDLHFGDEMCVFYAQTIDETGLGNIACDGGGWTGF